MTAPVRQDLDLGTVQDRGKPDCGAEEDSGGGAKVGRGGANPRNPPMEQVFMNITVKMMLE